MIVLRVFPRSCLTNLSILTRCQIFRTIVCLSRFGVSSNLSHDKYFNTVWVNYFPNPVMKIFSKSFSYFSGEKETACSCSSQSGQYVKNCAETSLESKLDFCASSHYFFLFFISSKTSLASLWTEKYFTVSLSENYLVPFPIAAADWRRPHSTLGTLK